jgi:hypothetical protein
MAKFHQEPTEIYKVIVQNSDHGSTGAISWTLMALMANQVQLSTQSSLLDLWESIKQVP